jgi:hypothetical protein
MCSQAHPSLELYENSSKAKGCLVKAHPSPLTTRD